MDYLNVFNWEDFECIIFRIWKRVNDLFGNEDVVCCWMGKWLKYIDYVIDYVFFFVWWFNNDFWNFFFIKVKINLDKLDKLFIGLKLLSFREFIVFWWK